MGGPECCDKPEGIILKPNPRWLAEEAKAQQLRERPRSRSRQRRQQRPARAQCDLILLSFFDGVGSALIICERICQEKDWQWRALVWETDEDLVKLTSDRFSNIEHRGDFDCDSVGKVIETLEQLDPRHEARIVIAGGPPCHDSSRIRQNPPGLQGEEGSKAMRFAEFVRELEATWNYPQAILVVENVVPKNKQDVRVLETKLSASAVVADASDLGVISRPRLWWSRIPWQEFSNRRDRPVDVRWSTYQGVPRASFVQPKDNLALYDLGGLQWPSNVTKKGETLPCLTTPSEDPCGRSAPKSYKGKADSQTQARWLNDGRQYAPWHYEEGNLFIVPETNALVMAPAEVKEQLQHLPKGWTASLPDKQRHRALANGWHLGVAKWFFILGLFAADPVTKVAALPSPSRELSPLGSRALEGMARLWESSPLLSGPGVPVLCEALDLSAIDDMNEHWAAAEFALHSDQTRPLLEPGLDQWLPLWKHWKPHLAEIRKGVAADVRTLVEEMQPEVDAWFQNLEPHVKLAYGSKTGTCTVKVPVIAKIAKMFGWQDDSLFQEMSSGFPLLGHINPGLGWRLRHDERYSDPVDLETFQADNFQYVQKKLKQARVDPFWQTMAEEIAADVKAGRMEGPFAAPSSWSKETVALPDYTHTAELLPAPSCHEHTCFAFSVQQVGSDGRRKVRRAEDWRRSGSNKTVNVPDTPAYHSIEAFIAVIRALRHLGEEGAIATWGLDHESAYRQLPVLRPADTYVVLQTPRGPTLWRHRVLMFGSVARVWGYCRVADWMAWASRCLLLTPALHFVDDFGAPETCPEADTSFQYVQTVCSDFGFRFKQSKAQPPAQRQQLQGVSLTVHKDHVVVEATRDRVARLDNQILEALMEDRLTPTQAATLAGKLQFVAQSLFGQSSKASLRPLHQRAAAAYYRSSQTGWRLSPGLRSALEFLRFALAVQKPRKVLFKSEDRAIIYADAFFQLDGKVVKIGDAEDVHWGQTNPAAFCNGFGFVVKTGERVWYAAGSVPYWFLRHFCSRRAYIFVLEAIAQILPVLALQQWLPKQLLLFMDNEPSRRALVRGYGRDDSVNKLMQVAWRFFEEEEFRPEWQRVTSSANISDKVSRFDFADAENMGWTWLQHDWEAELLRLLNAVKEGPLRAKG